MITPHQQLLNPPDPNAQGRPGSKALQHGQFISRIFTDASGQQFRLTFFVTIVAGEAKGHLVSAQPIVVNGRWLMVNGKKPSSVGSPFLLPVYGCKQAFTINYLPLTNYHFSPFTELFFFTSQPTRAPSFARILLR